jgi:hypothetical protein
MARPIFYEFDVTGGEFIFQIIGAGSTSSAMEGTFGITIYQSDCHISVSDTFLLGPSNIGNADQFALVLAGLATANIKGMSARVMDFVQVEPGHVTYYEPIVVGADSYFEATVLVSGAFTTTFTTATWAGVPLPVTVEISPSGCISEVVTASIGVTFPYEIGISEIGTTLTLDMIVSVIGTAHVVPDPALGGITALGLGGAGAWLRRRRS